MFSTDEHIWSTHDTILMLSLWVYGICHIALCLVLGFFVFLYLGFSVQFVVVLCALPLTTIPSLSGAIALEYSKPFAKRAINITAIVSLIIGVLVLITGWRYILYGRDFVALGYAVVNVAFALYSFWRAPHVH
jgi:hypothetical protein